MVEENILINIEQSNEKGQFACEGAKVWQCTRAEAIEKIAIAMRDTIIKTKAEGSCLDMAEAALNALLGE